MDFAETLSITLPGDLVQAVRARVDDGSYRSSSDVIRAAMLAWIVQENTLAALDTAVARGLADAASGRVRDTASLRAELSGRWLDTGDVGGA